MKISIVGGGPAGLYFGLLAKKAEPDRQIDIYERNRPDDTFGFGVVFSDETLSGFLDYDRASHREIVDSFAYWHEIDVRLGGRVVRSGGHGFCGMSRRKLLQILQHHAQAAGCALHFEHEIIDPSGFADSDLILAADGINSALRDARPKAFGTSLDWRRNKFVWLGTSLPLEAFTFIFEQNQHGLFRVHAYQFEAETSTFIVECTEETWRRAGLDQAAESDTLAYCQKLFAAHLEGHELVANRSLWRTFPTVRNERWYDGNVVLLGDALHTAHFSIGSGTKLAMEDAIALHEALQATPDVAGALAAYQGGRQDEVARLQRTAETSLIWFEDTERYHGLEPEQFAFSLLSRSKRVTYENLRLRDPDYIAGIDAWFAEDVRKKGLPLAGNPPPMFTPFRLGDLVLANRVVVSPMCQYSARDGLPGDWHLVHLGSRAVGGAGLVFSEMTGVSAQGRITPGCTGIYNQAQCDAWLRIVDFVHASSAAKICLQLGHAGQKAATKLIWEGDNEPLDEGSWPIISASPLPWFPHSQVPRQMDRQDMGRVSHEFVRAARYAQEAGFDMIEVHMAHGYLLSSFISPLSNQRGDDYGGILENRLRYPLEVFQAVREVWQKPISVRLSATDWVPGEGFEAAEAVELARGLKALGCDIIDVSAGQTSTRAKPVYGRMFQTQFAERIRLEAGIPTIAVGNITSADQVNTIIAAGRADLCVLARPHLSDPYFTLRAAAHYGQADQPWPEQYSAGRDQALTLAERQNEELVELRLAVKPARPTDDAAPAPDLSALRI